MISNTGLSEVQKSIRTIEYARKELMSLCKSTGLDYESLASNNLPDEILLQNRYQELYRDVLGDTFTTHLESKLPVCCNVVIDFVIDNYVGGDLTRKILRCFYGLCKNLTDEMVGNYQIVATRFGITSVLVNQHVESALTQLRHEQPSYILATGCIVRSTNPYAEFYTDIFSVDEYSCRNLITPADYAETTMYVINQFVSSDLARIVLHKYYDFYDTGECKHDMKKIAEQLCIAPSYAQQLLDSAMQDIRSSDGTTLMWYGLKDSPEVLNRLAEKKNKKSFFPFALDFEFTKNFSVKVTVDK